MKKVLALLTFMVCLCVTSWGQTRQTLQGDCEQGNNRVTTDGRTSTTRVQRSYPACTVTVYDGGTTNLATIASDEAGTPKANPFTADADGHWLFWGTVGRYDVRFSGAGITSPYTRPYQWIVVPGGGGGGAPTDATYITVTSNVTLTNERVLTAGTNITIVDTGANSTLTVNAIPTAPTSSVQFNDAGVFGGDAGFLYNKTTDTISLGAASTTQGILALRNSASAFITSLQAGSATSSFDVKLFASLPAGSAECVQISSTGQLSATGSACGGGGGGVSGSGTPTEMAYWVGATTLGSAPAVFVNANSTIEFRKATYSLTTVLVDGATIASNWVNTNRFRVTLGGNRTLSNPTNAADGQQVVYEIIQDETGSRALVFDTKFMFGAEITSCVTSSAAANRRSYITTIYNLAADKFSIVGCVNNYQ